MTHGFELRPIGRGHVDRLAAADPRLHGDPRYRDHIGELLAEDLSWAAFAGDTAIGFAMVTRRFYGFPFVDLLVVGEAHQRAGVGSALMARCEAAHTADRIFTSTNESNAPMRRLLAEAGWTPAGVVHYLDPGDPELIFVKLRAPD